MTKARVSWISEKGYGFLKLSDGTYAYAGSSLLGGHKVGAEFMVMVRHHGERRIVEKVSPIRDLFSDVAS